MNTYEEMFERLENNAAEKNDLIGNNPVHLGGADFIYIHTIYTMNDGIHVEAILREIDGMAYLTFAIEKKEFDESGNTDFLKYISGKGLFLQDLTDRTNNGWKYLGFAEKEGHYLTGYFQIG